MTNLDSVISKAFASEGKQEDVNKVYLALLKTQLYLPIKKDVEVTEDEPFSPLHAVIDGNYFLLVFDTEERLANWAGDNLDQINYVEITGRDVIAGISDSVYLCLNHGSEFYKEFSPDEVKKLKMIVSRIDQFKTKES